MGNGGRRRCDGHTPPQAEEGPHLEMAAVNMFLLGVCYVSHEPPVAHFIDFNRNVTQNPIIAPRTLIRDFLLSVGPEIT